MTHPPSPWEIHYRRLFEASADGLLLLQAPTCIIVDFNPSLLSLLACSASDLLGKKLWDVGAFQGDVLEPSTFSSLEENKTLNYTDISLRARDGRPLRVDFSCTAYTAGSEKFIQCIIHDVTGSKQDEASLLLQSAALNAAASAIMITDPSGIIEWVNHSFTTLTGYPFPESVGKRPGDLLKSGRQDENFYKRLWDTVSAGRVWRSELINHRKDGSLYTEEETITPLKNSAGKITHFISIKLDVTERKLAEARIQEQLEHLTALGAIDRIIAANFDLKLSLSEILSYVMAELHADAADILVLNPHSQVLEYGAGVGFITYAIQEVQLRLGQGLAGQAALERHLVEASLIDDSLDSSALPPHLQQEGFACYFGEPLIAKGQVKGVLEVYSRKPFDPEVQWCDFLASLAGQTAIAIDNSTLFESLNRSNSELILAYDATIEGWSRALDLRDHETEGHTQRVTTMTVKLARSMGVSEADLVQVRWGSLLHDIGKMGISDQILRKSGPLTSEEVEEMKKHPIYAFDMLSSIRYLHMALDIPYCHHEKWDGSGYPRGLKGEQIPLLARIFSIVDVWDALLNDRPYRPAWTQADVLEHIRSLSGTHFDPAVVEAFLNLPDWKEKWPFPLL